MTKRKQKGEFLPPNHPDRPDWHFFTDIIGRPIAPPPDCSKEDACALLKSFLLESYVFHFDKLFAACGRGALDRVMNDPGFRGQTREDWLQFFKDKLVLPHDSAPNEARIKDKEKGYSGNALTYWDPNASGIVTYFKYRLDFIFKSLKQTDKPYHTTISLQKLAEMRLEPTEDSTWIRPPTARDDVVEPNEALLHAIGTKEAVELTRHGAFVDPMNEETNTRAVVREKQQLLERMSESNSAHLARLSDLRHRMKECPDRDNWDRPEYTLFEMALGRFITPMDSPEARAIQLREKALEVIQHRGRGLITPEDVAAGITFDDLLEDIKGWNPREETFLECFPDAVDLIERQLISEAENGVRKELLEVEIRHSASVAARRSKQLVKALERGPNADAAAGEFLNGVIGRKDDQKISIGSLRWQAFRATHKVFHGLESTDLLKSEKRVIMQSIKEWFPPEKNIGIACPDLVAKGMPLWNKHLLDKMTKTVADTGVNVAKSGEPKARIKPPEELTAMLFSQAEVRRLEEEGPEVFIKPSPELAVKENRFWSTSARNQADLDNPARPDFTYLASFYGLPARADLAPEEMHTLMRSLSPMFVNKLCHNLLEAKQDSFVVFSTTKMNAMKAVALHYNPASDGYLGECLQEAIRNPNFVMEQIRRKVGEPKPTGREALLFAADPDTVSEPNF